ncbi:ribonuclease H-like domain-containing protein [Tanacetum coccineum]|uniref:Ribonuclease H-like domain-containing protein n=1 Tax=Tanacetum coccineum TaxID=301880 RepID=A0ABQ5GT27_9ASTR
MKCLTTFPNDDGRDPSGSNIDSNSNSDDIAEKQSFDDDQGSVQIGEENFPEGNVPENNNVPTHFLDIGESSGLRRSSTLSKLPTKLNDYVLNSKAMYGLDKFVNHTWLSAENCGFIANINKSFEPKSYEEAAHDKNWVEAMNEEMQALYENNTWILTDLPKNRKAIGSKWVFRIKHKSTCEIDRYNARLLAKGFNQREVIDYEETLVQLLKWELLGFKQRGHDHSLYTKESGGSFVALLVYVDDIVLTVNETEKVKGFLSSKFKIKDLGELKYFLRIEVLKTEKRCLSTPLHKNIVLAHIESIDDKLHKNITSYQRLSHMDLGLRVLRYLKGALGSGVDYEKSEHIKKQATFSKSSAEAEYRSMAAATCKLLITTSGAGASNINLISSLNAGNPLHLQTNDNNSGSLINIKLTGFENYRVWATAMKIALQARNKMVFADGLDDVYQPIRSTLLTQTELPDVRDACVIVCREESHRGLGSSLGVQKPQKNSSGIPFINEQTAKLMSLIGDKPSNGIHSNMAGANQHITSSTKNMTYVVDITDLNITVGHPNETDLKRENVLWTGNEAGGLYVFNTEMQIGEENFPEGNVPKNNNVPTYFFDTEESNGLRRSSRQSKHPAKLNDYVQIVKLGFKQSGHDHSLYTKESGGSFVAFLSTPLPENIVLAHKESTDDKLLKNITSYQRLPHMDIGLRVPRYLKGALRSGVDYEKSEHVFMEKQKQATFSKSSAEVEYRSMAAATCEVMWIVNVLKDLKVTNLLRAKLYCDNSAAV